MKLKIAIIMLLLTGSLLFCEGSFDDSSYSSGTYENEKIKELKEIQASEWKSCRFDKSFEAEWDLFASEECVYQYYKFSKNDEYNNEWRNKDNYHKDFFTFVANRRDGKIEEYNGTYSIKYNDSNNSGILELTFTKVFVGIKTASSSEGKWQDIDIHKRVLFRTEGTIKQGYNWITDEDCEIPDGKFSFYFFDITDYTDFPYENCTLYDMDRIFSKIYPNEEVIRCTADSNSALRYGSYTEYNIDTYYSNHFNKSLARKYLLTYKR